MLKLNLGCGPDIKDGYVNVDIINRKGVDIVLDVVNDQFPLNFLGNVDEILMYDFLEHTSHLKFSSLMYKIYSLLKEDGVCIVQVPDLEELSRVILCIPEFRCNECGFVFLEKNNVCDKCGTKYIKIVENAIRRMYGGQNYASNFHLSGFSKELIIKKFSEFDLQFIEFLEEDHQLENWNFKVKFKKNSKW